MNLTIYFLEINLTIKDNSKKNKKQQKKKSFIKNLLVKILLLKKYSNFACANNSVILFLLQRFKKINK